VGFSSPLILAALVAVPLLGAGIWLAQKRRARSAVRFAAADMLEGLMPKRDGRRWLPPALLLVAAALGVVAAAGPTADVEIPREQATLVITLDVSLSMKATDVKPDRLSAAKKAAEAAVTKLPSEMRAGVVAFAGTAQVVQAPTRDREATVASIDGLQLAPYTAIGDGLLTSLDAINAVDPTRQKASAVVLMSDGENTTGVDPSYAAERAKELGVPVFTVAFGRQGATIEVDGQRIPVDPNVGQLRAIADATGGKFFESFDSASFERIISEVGSRIGLERSKVSLTPWFVGAAIILALVALGLSLWWYGRLL
jgi:Ca-activated chloride channel family protein